MSTNDEAIRELAGLLYDAWAVIANAGEGNWQRETPEWRAAAEAWRDRWHATLPAAPSAREAAHTAVHVVLRQHPPRSASPFEQASENARVWRAVEVALDVMEKETAR